MSDKERQEIHKELEKLKQQDEWRKDLINKFKQFDAAELEEEQKILSEKEKQLMK